MKMINRIIAVGLLVPAIVGVTISPTFAHAKKRHHAAHKHETTQTIALMLARRDGPGQYTIDYNAGNIAFNINDIISWSGGSPSYIGKLTIRTQHALSERGIHETCENVLMIVENGVMGHHIGNRAAEVFQAYANFRVEGVSDTDCIQALSKYVVDMG